MEFWSTDIGNAYLESFTKEKLYIIAGDEFGNRKGHVLIISRALYGLKSSGLQWHEHFADVLRSTGFVPSRAENDIWMRDKGDHYEYIAVYVDDLAIARRDPQAIIDCLVNEHNFKLKGTGPIKFHLGCDFSRDKDAVLYYAPLKYIEKIIDNYTRVFGQRPKQHLSPLVKGDHPELDSSELLDEDGIKIYQSLIGCLQWAVQIGRFDITTAVMTMSRFRASVLHHDKAILIASSVSMDIYPRCVMLAFACELIPQTSLPSLKSTMIGNILATKALQNNFPRMLPSPKGSLSRCRHLLMRISTMTSSVVDPSLAPSTWPTRPQLIGTPSCRAPLRLLLLAPNTLLPRHVLIKLLIFGSPSVIWEFLLMDPIICSVIMRLLSTQPLCHMGSFTSAIMLWLYTEPERQLLLESSDSTTSLDPPTLRTS